MSVTSETAAAPTPDAPVALENDDMTVLMFGALLHDIGKVVYRGISEKGTHSKLGADFLNEIAARRGQQNDPAVKRIIEQVRHHHGKEMDADHRADNSLAYITYFADNISAGMDRKDEGDETQAPSFDRSAKLEKIFNILNGHHDHNTVDHEDYNVIRESLKANLDQTDIAWNQVNSLINLLERYTDRIPSSTDTTQLVDVSLYDHLKTTAGIAACIYKYLQAHGVVSYRKELFDQRRTTRYWAEDMFLLYSCDMSGIQDFIYSISGDGALKQLRARSMYLELLLEHIADELLDKLHLSRANLLYTGGGHAYLLLPNTKDVQEDLNKFQAQLQDWFVQTYRNDLYVASAWVACSADDLANKDNTQQGAKRYRNLFREVTRRLSDKKAHRYSAETIKAFNFGDEGYADHERECTECHRSDLEIDADGKCDLCATLGAISKQLINKDVFVISETKPVKGGRPGLELPFNKWLYMFSQAQYKNQQPEATRIYTKNDWNMGIKLATHIWMADYTMPTEKDENGDPVGIASYAKHSVTLPVLDEATGQQFGIERLGVLRADVDNLGTIFVRGLPDDKISISRTVTLSRALSYFFKKELNDLLNKKQYQAQVIYSGGDDLFIIGNWSDIIQAAVDIKKAFDDYVGNGTITLSAGIGMYDAKFPIARMAQETGELEDAAKLYVDPQDKEKNAVALWTEDAVFSWDEFSAKVMDRRDYIKQALEGADKGKAFVYKLVDLLRSSEKVSAPRLAYLLARSFEDVRSDKEKSDAMMQIYEWATDENEKKCLEAALEWYVYSIRERG